MSFLSGISAMQFVAIGAVGMFIVGILSNKYNEFRLLKLIVNTILLTVSGVFGTMVMYLIETGEFGGLSYYGAVLFIPVFMAFFAFISKQNMAKVLDFSAYGSCAMLAVMKVDCLVKGCCYGRTFATSGFTFPSRILEGINGFIIMLILLKLLQKYHTKLEGKIYPIYFIIYGCTRFVYNFFRGDLEAFLWIIPQGHLWSIISIIIGVVWLAILLNKDKKIEQQKQQELAEAVAVVKSNKSMKKSNKKKK